MVDDTNPCEDIFSKSIDPQPKPEVPKKRLAKVVFVLSAIIVIVALSVMGVTCAYRHTHTLIYITAVQPTCDTAGSMSYWQCTECKKCFSFTQGKNAILVTSIGATGHNFGEWQESKQSTCTQEGEAIRYCANDNTHYETKIVPMLSHQLSITQNGCIYSEICEVCNKVIRVGQHTYENGVCVKCGRREYIIAPLEEYTLGQTYSEEHVFDPTNGYWFPHEGVDFLAPAGSEVRCIEDGVIKDITTDSYSATVVTIEHSDGFTSVYKFICDSDLKIGDIIAQGDVIGKVSDTALAESTYGPHLHLELYKDGVKINPLDYMIDVVSKD